MLPSDASSPAQFQTRAVSAPGAAVAGTEVTLRARQQEKQGDIYKLSGDVEIDYRNLVLRADEITYNAESGEVTATGHLVLDGGAHDEHIEASHGSYNIRTQTGGFYDVAGTTGARFRGPHVVLTSSSPFAFTGRRVEKVSPDRYLLYHGSVTACELPRPKWTFNAEKIDVDVGGEARIYNSTFRVERVPILFFPYAQHPVESLGRQTGFLVPTVGTSSIKGLILGDAVYWAINRSADATAGAEYFSKRGWSQHGEFRWRPAEDAFLKATYFGVLDRGVGNPKQNQGGEDITLDGEAHLPMGFRGVASAEYLNSFLFRLAFGETFTEAVNSEVKSNVFVSRSSNGYSVNLLFGRYQNFQSTQPGDVVTIQHLPSFDVGSVDRRIANSPIYWSFGAAAEGVSRKEPGFLTADLVSRLDAYPRASLPVFYRGWTLRPEVGLRDTYYGQSLLPAGSTATPINTPVNRHALVSSVEVRPPSLDRIFEREVLGHKIKHVIEPRVVYHYVTGVDNFRNIIRFDSRDILSDTNDVEYSVVQRLYAKPARERPCQNHETAKPKPAQPTPAQSAGYAPPSLPTDGCNPGGSRELVSWEFKQKYFFDPSFGGALTPGIRNVFTATDNFTGIAFLTEERHFSPVVSRMRVLPSPNTDLGWELDYDTLRGRINGSTLFLNYRIGDFFTGASHAYLLDVGEIGTTTVTALPTPEKFNQYRLLLGYGNPNRRGINTAINVAFDANVSLLQYTAFQTSYNWDCCGLSAEYRRYSLGLVQRDNQYRFAFTLANIGTFGNMKRQERIF